MCSDEDKERWLKVYLVNLNRENKYVVCPEGLRQRTLIEK